MIVAGASQLQDPAYDQLFFCFLWFGDCFGSVTVRLCVGNSNDGMQQVLPLKFVANYFAVRWHVRSANCPFVYVTVELRVRLPTWPFTP